MIALLVWLPACDELPRDPEQTLLQAKQDSLLVGIIESSPWTQYRNGQFAGAEVELVEQFAAELGTDITWVRGSESDLMPALERFELHLVIGGITKPSPWAKTKRVGLSRPYFTTRHVVAVPAGQRVETLEGQPVAVKQGSPLAAIARQRGADVVTVANLSDAAVDAVVAPDWQVELLNREATDLELHRERHVMAVPPGENGLLMRLDRFLERRSGGMADRLRQAEAEAQR